MTDSPRDPYAGVGPDNESSTGMPRWVKVFGIIALVVVLLVVVVLLTRGTDHGPGRHFGLGDLVGRTPQPSVVDIRTPPGGGNG